MSITGDTTGLAVVGLPGEVLRIVEEVTELADSFVLSLLCEKVECTELIRVLELLPGSLFIVGRICIGVDGLMGRGTRLVRRWKLPTTVSTPIFWGSFPFGLGIGFELKFPVGCRKP
jgi:hypothetical protein